MKAYKNDLRVRVALALGAPHLVEFNKATTDIETPLDRGICRAIGVGAGKTKNDVLAFFYAYKCHEPLAEIEEQLWENHKMRWTSETIETYMRRAANRVLEKNNVLQVEHFLKAHGISVNPSKTGER